ncbi:hypothetical protein IIA15_08790 [candidate division TA06 bacterium]|nr:hypothetical protein [candidate division TA06 bacterium]
MILHMVKMEILGLKRHLHDVVTTLQELGSVHIEEKTDEIHLPRFLKPVELDEEKKKERASFEKFESLLQELLPLLVTKDAEPSLGHDRFDEKRYEELDSLKQEINALVSSRNKRQEELVLAKKYEAALKAYLPLLEKFKQRDDTLTSLIRFDKGGLKALKGKLVRLTKDDFFLEIEKGEDALYGALAYSREREDAIKEELWQEGVDEVVLPSEFQGKDPKESLQELARRKETLPKTIQDLVQKITQLQKKEAPGCLRMNVSIQERLGRYRILTAFSESDYTFYLTAWVPEDEKRKVVEKLKNKFQESVVLQELVHEKWEHEEIPVKLKNPKWLKPFEVLVSIFPPPTYGTIDATPFVAFFFPLFFGLILGDIGYGIVLFLLTLFLRIKFRKNETVRQVSKIGFVCVATTIAFGFVFGEFFGTLGHGWLKPIWADRLLITTQLLILSILLGVVHVLLGLFLGMVVAFKERNGRHLLEKIGFLIFFFGILFVVHSAMLPRGGGLPFLGGLSAFTAAVTGGFVILVSFVLLFAAAGLQGAIESISIVSNILSYARLMAIGVASAAMAKVANDLGAVAGGVVGFLIAFTLHTINMALGIFAPTVQALRLNYVEFFTKFYRPGGREYTPFKKIS